MEKNRIANLNTYIENHYPGARFIESSDLELPDFLQREFNDSHNNCTIASLTRVINYYFRDKDKFEIYDEVFAIAKKNGYFKKIGTLPVMISHIANIYFKKNKIDIRARGIYLGNFYSHVKDEIDNFRPLVMNLGSGYYKNHSLVISGYSIYKFKGMKVKFLHVYDGWNKTKSYIDYNDLRGFLKVPIFSYNVFDVDIGEDL